MADEMIEDIKHAMNGQPVIGDPIEDEEPLWLVLLPEHIVLHAKFYKVILASMRVAIFTERLLTLLTDIIFEKLERMGNDSYFRIF
ncbi:hypothetical protein ACN6MY_12815 [Peribacillus sp. B-H-3]|uniref:hypothetical protein n=1 Tax=Peribacillus sp. B-H-3 TaxID=3400420 RepID=UPI003B02757F